MNKGTFYIDSDSFFWPSDISDDYMFEYRRGVSFDDERISDALLFEQYYLGFRSSLIISEETITDERKAMKALEDWRKACISSARNYTLKHLNGDFSLPVDFMWITKMKIINEIKNEFPNAENIPLKLSMKPRISAYTKNKNTIVFPALIRSVLNHCNLVLLNNSFHILENESKSIDRQFLARFILPYLLFCHDDFSVRNLPIIGGCSNTAISMALSFTNIQVMYIFAHEYAHILLNHFDDKNVTQKTKEMLEREADDFALRVILQYIKTDDNYDENDVFTAIRWLFKYQLIEDSIGKIIVKNDLNNFLSTYEERRVRFQNTIIENCNIVGATLIDSVGFCSIVEVQSVLYEYGAELIEKIIHSFKKSEIKGEIEPWWKMIAQE